MIPNEAYDRLRVAIPRRPELRFKTWSPDEAERLAAIELHPYLGFCYIATQVFCHLVKGARPWSFQRSHFWAVHEGTIYDPTADQFPEPFAYEVGAPTRFKGLCARAEALLEEVLAIPNDL